MKIAAVAELKAELSRFLRRVKAGEDVLVTQRGIPVARIVPVTRAGSDTEQWRDLEQQGLMSLGSGKPPKSFWELPRGRDTKASLRKAVREEREAGW